MNCDGLEGWLSALGNCENYCNKLEVMFEKLKRAKSFVIRSKPRPELDLPETSHLRRTIPINAEALFGNRDATLRHNYTQQEVQGASRYTSETKIDKRRDVIPDDSVRSNSRQEEQIDEQFKRLTFQVWRDTIEQNQKTELNNYKQNTTGKKVTRSKSARETKSQFMKKYQNKFSKHEEMWIIRHLKCVQDNLDDTKAFMQIGALKEDWFN